MKPWRTKEAPNPIDRFHGAQSEIMAAVNGVIWGKEPVFEDHLWGRCLVSVSMALSWPAALAAQMNCGGEIRSTWSESSHMLELAPRFSELRSMIRGRFPDLELEPAATANDWPIRYLAAFDALCDALRKGDAHDVCRNYMRTMEVALELAVREFVRAKPLEW